MKRYSFAFVPFALFLAACGDGGTSVDLNGKTPEEQADTVAEAACEPLAECGQYQIDISQEGETIVCTATLEEQSTEDIADCEMDVHDNALEIFSNCELSDEDLNTIESCFNAVLSQPCITQAEADAYCDAIEAGEENPDFGPPQPAVCDDADAIIEGCAPA